MFESNQIKGSTNDYIGLSKIKKMKSFGDTYISLDGMWIKKGTHNLSYAKSDIYLQSTKHTWVK